MTYSSSQNSYFQFKTQTVVSEPHQWNLYPWALRQLQRKDAYILISLFNTKIRGSKMINIIAA